MEHDFAYRTSQEAISQGDGLFHPYDIQASLHRHHNILTNLLSATHHHHENVRVHIPPFYLSEKLPLGQYYFTTMVINLLNVKTL